VRSTPIVLNDLVLLGCVSMYFGTGWSLVLFSFPIRARLTVKTYYDQFVPQVTRATRFFTPMTVVMIVTAIVMLISEWNDHWWAPAIVLAGVLAATGLTMRFILPLNKVMEAGITDPKVLDATLRKWMGLNRIRVGLWTMQWLAMAAYFGVVLGRG
jgi:hypothetical protein